MTLSPTFPWKNIHTLLLDMDGTLLDLHFDSIFWKEHIPRQYAAKRGLDINTAKNILTPHFRATEHTLDWYCIDYWSKALNLDVGLLKQDLKHLIRFKPYAQDFLTLMRQQKKQLILVTNAHEKSISIKLEHTLLDQYIDQIISAHDIGHAKESPLFWKQLEQACSFDKKTSLLIDDNIYALQSAKDYGVKHLLAISKPSTQEGIIDTGNFIAVEGFEKLIHP